MNHHPVRIPVLLLILLFAVAQVQGLGIRGSLKLRIELTDSGDGGGDVHFTAISPMRVMLSQNQGRTRFDLAYSLSPSGGNPAIQSFGGETSPSPYRIADLKGLLIPADTNPDASISILQNLDRLSAKFRLPFATVTLGRQAVYWGLSRSVSPTDFIAPFQYGTIDTEYRVGVDAVRSVFPTGMLSEIEAGWLFGRDADIKQSGGWTRGRFYILQSDVTLLAGFFRENLIIGGSANRAFGGATGWVETAVVTTDALSKDGSERDSYWSLSAGFERSWLEATLSGYLEYHFNSAGAADPDDYRQVQTEPAYTQGDVYLLGRHYLAPGASFMVTPLLKLDLGGLVNLTDPSAYLSLAGSYGATENITLSAGANMGLGKGSGSSGEPRSEFGNWPGTSFISAAWYF